ncbi:MAG TPA: MarR family transcriptional regulator [Actinomycetota bacterium]|jgi:DNA-binding MarR family transcriptional regulator
MASRGSAVPKGSRPSDPGTSDGPGHDHVDRILDQWARERPDLDVSTFAVFARITRASRALERAMASAFRAYGLSRGEFDVLVSLRRAGAPYRLNPSDLAQALLLSTGTMTNRIDRLERAGWVVRHPDPQDRRGILVQLTDVGLHTVNAAMDSLLGTERELLSVLGAEDRKVLAGLLRRVVLALDERGPEAGREAVPGSPGRPATGSP